jgi:hypothetical protein
MRERELGIITLIEDAGEPEVETPAAAAARTGAEDDSAEDEVAEEAGK